MISRRRCLAVTDTPPPDGAGDWFTWIPAAADTEHVLQARARPSACACACADVALKLLRIRIRAHSLSCAQALAQLIESLGVSERRRADGTPSEVPELDPDVTY